MSGIEVTIIFPLKLRAFMAKIGCSRCRIWVVARPDWAGLGFRFSLCISGAWIERQDADRVGWRVQFNVTLYSLSVIRYRAHQARTVSSGPRLGIQGRGPL